MRALFVITAGLLAWTYGGYLAFLRALRLARPPAPAPAAATELPTVTVLVLAFNEESTIAGKIENSLALEYPEDRLNVIVASDGSTDRTNQIVTNHPSPRVRLLPFTDRRGKALLSNDAVAAARGTWLLFTDAETRFQPDALLEMARHFGDPAVGMVDGELVCVNSDTSSIAADVGLYWRLESALKTAESELGCLSSTFGACSALRRALFEPLLPTEDIDFRTPLDLVAEGYRVVHEPLAQAAEVTHSGLREQFRARVRMVTKNLPGTLRRIDGRIARRPLVLLGIVSHKLLRWFTPYLLIANLLASLSLARRRGVHRLPAVAHAALLALGAVGGAAWRRGRSAPLASSVFSFLVANAGFLVGVANSARGVEIAVYRPSQELASLPRQADEPVVTFEAGP
jgi:hypothetical protein